MLPLFLVTRDTKVPESVDRDGHEVIVMPTVKGEGNLTTRAYLSWCYKHGYLKKNELCLMDSHNAHKNDEVLDWFEDKEILHYIFPKGAGSFMNPCDNSYNSDFKNKYYRIISTLAEKNNITHIKKIEAIFQAYEEVKDNSIVHYFQHTGILGRQTKSKVKKLLNESYKMNPEKRQQHHDQLNKYFHFCNSLKIPVERDDLEEGEVQLYNVRVPRFDASGRMYIRRQKIK